MKTFLPLFVGLAAWFLIAAMVLTTFVSAGPLVPVETPAAAPAPLEVPPPPAPQPETEVTS